MAGLPESITVEASDLLYELNFARTGILTFGAGKELKREDMGTVIFTFSLEVRGALLCFANHIVRADAVRIRSLSWST